MSTISRDASPSHSPDASLPHTALLDPAVLFATAHGALHWTDDGALRLDLDGIVQTVSRDTVRTLHRSVRSLARDVYHCEHGCRWQVRLPNGTVLVLNSDDVLRLDTLLDGAVAMLDLYAVLDAAGVDAPGRRHASA